MDALVGDGEGRLYPGHINQQMGPVIINDIEQAVVKPRRTLWVRSHIDHVHNPPQWLEEQQIGVPVPLRRSFQVKMIDVPVFQKEI